MDAGRLAAGLSWNVVLTTAVGAYALSIAIFLSVLENRSPQSTFAWLFLLLVFPLVAILQSVFATMWYNTTGESLFDEQYFPEVHEHEGGVAVQVVSAGPDSQWEAIRQAYLAMIALAHRHVYLQSPFLILDASVAEALKTAALAGVDVRVMIAPRGAEVSPAYRAAKTYAADMARAGVQVLLW